MTVDPTDQLLDYAIRARAYELWLDAGEPSGQSLALWHQAENELRKERGDALDRALKAVIRPSSAS